LHPTAQDEMTEMVFGIPKLLCKDLARILFRNSQVTLWSQAGPRNFFKNV